LANDRPSRNPNPTAETLQIWRNPAGVLHVGKNGWEAMIVFEGGKLVALDKLGKRWVHHDLSKAEWDRVKAEMAKGKIS
jgi:hypothetical protein